MSGKYIIRRILLLFSGLFTVVFLAFLLKSLVPGDPVESILMNRGMTLQETDLKSREYSKIYKQEGLHKPLFYFSVLPDHYPENIRTIPDPLKKSEISKLLKQGYLFADIQEFITLKMRISKQKNDSPSDSLIFLLFQHHQTPDQLLSSLQNQKISDREIKDSCMNVLSKMKNNKKSWFFPVIHLYGTNNQFHDYFKKLFIPDFGTSSKDGKKVTKKIFSALIWTSTLVFFSMFLLALISIPLGLWSGRYEFGKLDRWVYHITVFLYAIPVFWLASMLIIFCTSGQYAWWLNIFPTVGTWYDQPGDSFAQNLARHASQLILPVICLVANDFAFLIQLVKKQTIEQKKQLYVKMAIAKGLEEKTIMLRHILPNVGIQTLSVFIGSIPAAFAGSLIVEVIFNIPGMGRLLYYSIVSSDWNVVFGILIVLSFLTIIFNLAGDFLYARLNPKISYHD